LKISNDKNYVKINDIKIITRDDRDTKVIIGKDDDINVKLMKSKGGIIVKSFWE